MPRNPGNWLKAHAVGYESLARSEKRVLSDFMLLWSLFEAKLHDCDANVPKMFETLERWHELDAIEEDRSRRCWEYFCVRYNDEFDLDALRISNPSQREFINNAISTRTSHLLEIHKALSILVYRLRNNLLHGEKWSYGIAQQRGNFENANEMLMVWCEIHRRLNGYEL